MGKKLIELGKGREGKGRKGKESLFKVTNHVITSSIFRPPNLITFNSTVSRFNPIPRFNPIQSNSNPNSWLGSSIGLLVFREKNRRFEVLALAMQVRFDRVGYK